MGPQSNGPDLASDWSTEVSSSYALAGFLTLVLVAFTLLAMGPLVAIDGYFNIRHPPDGWLPVLHTLDRVGQRAVCLPILAVVVWRVVRESRSWRPVVVVVGSVLLVNLLVGVLKIILSRGEPSTGDPSFFSGGMAYPSGHTANIVLVYGLMPYLLTSYGAIHRRAAHLLAGLVAALSVMMVIVSLTLTWHWFADLVAGLLVGGIVLCLTHALDHSVLGRRTGAPPRVPGPSRAPAGR